MTLFLFGHRPPRRAPRAQRGQALIWMLGTLATCAAILYGVYNTAQITNGKAKAVNAADTAALAGATVEARMLNLMAYNNRSMMANEAFLVQLSALESWVHYLYETSERVGIILDFIPYADIVGEILGEVAEVAEEADEAIGKAIDVVIPVLEGEKVAFHAAHFALATLGGGVAKDAASKIVSANKADFNSHQDAGVGMDDRAGVLALTLVKNNADWIKFTKYYDGNQRADAKQVLLASRDEFSTNRPGSFIFNFGVPLVAQLEKNGGSKLVDYDRWENQDTLEFCVELAPKCQEVGWGRSNVSKTWTLGDKWPGGKKHPIMGTARNDGSTHTGWSGVPSVYDLAGISGKSKAADFKDVGVDFFVAVKRDQAANLTTQKMKFQTAHSASILGSSEMNERLQGNQLSAIGKARVFFERPRSGLANDWTGTGLVRPDNAKEYGSLYSPYWEARLQDFTTGEKAAMYTAMGIDPLLAPFTP